jgi:hypothetical protein
VTQRGFGPTPARLQRVKLKNGRVLKPLMIGTDGISDSGKSEFALSCPGPGLFICLDRNLDGMLDNPNPPSWRHTNFLYKVVETPVPSVATQSVNKDVQQDYITYWRNFHEDYKSALADAQALTVVVDGDSDSWELQRLAAFGKLTQIPPMLYTDVNAARRAYYARGWNSGKIVIYTNKVKPTYTTKLNPDGTPALSKSGEEIRVQSGDLERQGFSDQDYLFPLQIRHFIQEAKTVIIKGKTIVMPATFGIRIMKCKVNRDLIGVELTGADCNFASLVQTVYPDVPLEEWGL